MILKPRTSFFLLFNKLRKNKLTGLIITFISYHHILIFQTFPKILYTFIFTKI